MPPNSKIWHERKQGGSSDNIGICVDRLALECIAPLNHRLPAAGSAFKAGRT
jgi:hypothetical protein